jgi:probable HAF family extracellular repeat protein
MPNTNPRAKLHGLALLAPLARYLIVIAATVALLVISGGPVPAAAPEHHHYKLIDIGTFGGPQSFVNPGSGNETGNFALVLNSGGSVTGWAETSTPDPFLPDCFTDDCVIAHTFVWKDGAKLDLGALTRGASSAGNWISSNGLIAGYSENGAIDPLVGLPEVRATLWAHGRIIDLGTLPEGGFESIANAVNAKGQVVGIASNEIPDPNSMVASGFQTRAFIWQNGQMHDLGTLGTGTDAQAILINERGQVIGWSYVNSVPTSACNEGFAFVTGSFIWDKEKRMRDLGTLGGTCTTASDMNNRGQVVGFSNLPGDLSVHGFLWDNGLFQDLGGSLGGDLQGPFAVNEQGEAVGFANLPGNTIFHATLWKHIGELTDLGVLGTDQCSYATGINERLQIVGGSISDCTNFVGFRAFLWEDGAMLDLNALIPPDATLHLQFIETINNRGEVAGQGADAQNNAHAFLLIPCDGEHPNLEGCDYSPVKVSTVAASRTTETAPQKQLTPQEISRIRALLMKRHREFMPPTMR